MAAYAYGQPVTLTQTFNAIVNGELTPTDPPLTGGGIPGVFFRYVDPLGNALTWTYGTDVQVQRASVGVFYVTWTPSTPGQWRYRWSTLSGPLAGGEQSFDILDTVLAGSSLPAGWRSFAMVPPAVAYPYGTGYAQVTDVQDRINAMTWDASAGGAVLNPAQVSDFLLQATAQVDTVLAKAGYTVPLIPAPNFTAIGWQAWQLLRNVTAYLAGAMIENTRHSSAEADTDTKMDDLFALADDLLVRIETGADNLTAFGVAGPFTPEIDVSLAVTTGGATDFDGTDSTAPAFTRNMQF